VVGKETVHADLKPVDGLLVAGGVAPKAAPHWAALEQGHPRVRLTKTHTLSHLLSDLRTLIPKVSFFTLQQITHRTDNTVIFPLFSNLHIYRFIYELTPDTPKSFHQTFSIQPLFTFILNKLPEDIKKKNALS
jgi:hypothetical protein